MSLKIITVNKFSLTRALPDGREAYAIKAGRSMDKFVSRHWMENPYKRRN
jgi:hypothetical protein